MLEVAKEATVVAVPPIAWVEAMSTFCPEGVGGLEETPTIESSGGRFQQDWESFATVEVTQQLVEQPESMQRSSHSVLMTLSNLPLHRLSSKGMQCLSV